MLIVCGRRIAAGGPQHGEPKTGLHARRDTVHLGAEPKWVGQAIKPAAICPQRHAGGCYILFLHGDSLLLIVLRAQGGAAAARVCLEPSAGGCESQHLGESGSGRARQRVIERM